MDCVSRTCHFAFRSMIFRDGRTLSGITFCSPPLSICWFHHHQMHNHRLSAVSACLCWSFKDPNETRKAIIISFFNCLQKFITWMIIAVVVARVITAASTGVRTDYYHRHYYYCNNQIAWMNECMTEGSSNGIRRWWWLRMQCPSVLSWRDEEEIIMTVLLLIVFFCWLWAEWMVLIDLMTITREMLIIVINNLIEFIHFGLLHHSFVHSVIRVLMSGFSWIHGRMPPIQIYKLCYTKVCLIQSLRGWFHLVHDGTRCFMIPTQAITRQAITIILRSLYFCTFLYCSHDPVRNLVHGGVIGRHRLNGLFTQLLRIVHKLGSQNRGTFVCMRSCFTMGLAIGLDHPEMRLGKGTAEDGLGWVRDGSVMIWCIDNKQRAYPIPRAALFYFELCLRRLRCLCHYRHLKCNNTITLVNSSSMDQEGR